MNYLLKTERLIAIAALVSFVLKLFYFPGSGILVVASFSALTLIYFYTGLVIFNQLPMRVVFKSQTFETIPKTNIAISVLSGIVLSFISLGILFKIQSWPGSGIYLMLGSYGIIVTTCLVLIYQFKNNKTFKWVVLKRFMIFGRIGLFLYLLPTETWIEIKYRNAPKYV